jgi:signal transduction histidine kinase
VRQFQQVQTRTAELTRSLERQTATSEILRSISRSPTDYAPVFNTILENALRLCGAHFGVLYLLRGDQLHAVADICSDPRFSEYLRANPLPLDLPSAVNSRAAREQTAVQVTDLKDNAYDSGDEVRLAAVDIGGIRTLLGVPMLKGDQTVGVIGLFRQEVKPFTDDDIALVGTFADQAIIAIENVRQFQQVQTRTAELTKSLERQTATSEILRSISQSPTDYAPVFDTILENAIRLCGAPFGVLFLLRDNLLHLVAEVGVRREYIEWLQANPISLDHPVALPARAARARTPVQMADLMEEAYRSGDPLRMSSVDIGGIRTSCSVPMLKGDDPLGVIVLFRTVVKPFADDDIELVSTFADQAVIAIENVRLFQALEARTADLAKTLERQTATSEILRSISRSPTDFAPVFDSILENAIRLCGAPFGALFLLRDGHLHLVADAGLRSEFREHLQANPIPLDNPVLLVSRSARERMPFQSADLLDETSGSGDTFRRAIMDLGGVRSTFAVPMCKGEEIVGVIGVFRHEAKPFDERDIELVTTFADQAVIAIENVRLFQTVESRSAELTRSVTELEALGDVAQAVSSTLDLDTVLNTIVERAVQLSGADAGAINELDKASGTFLPPHAAPGMEEMIKLPPPRLGEGAVGRAAASRKPVQIADITAPGAYSGHLMDVLTRLRIRALLAVPMIEDDSVLGTLVVGRHTPGEFPAETVRLLRTLGTQSAIAIRNARLFREIDDKSRELETANRHKSEFLANMSHELRTPLNAVIGFSEVLGERMFGELNDKQGEYVQDIHDSGRHLLSLINDILDLSKIEAGAMELDVARFALDAALDNALTLVRERAATRGITLQMSADGELGEMQGDERKLKQILLNLLSNAIKFTAAGGTVTLEAKLDATQVHIAVRDTGVGISKEDQDVIFEEFRQVGTDYARKAEGTGLGLALTMRFVEMHGGRLSVESEPGIGSVFMVELPLRQMEQLA